MCLLMLFCNSKIHFHQLGPFKLIKTMLKSVRYISSVIQRVVTIHGVPSVQLSSMKNLKNLQRIRVWVQFGLLR